MFLYACIHPSNIYSRVFILAYNRQCIDSMCVFLFPSYICSNWQYRLLAYEPLNNTPYVALPPHSPPAAHCGKRWQLIRYRQPKRGPPFMALQRNKSTWPSYTPTGPALGTTKTRDGKAERKRIGCFVLPSDRSLALEYVGQTICDIHPAPPPRPTHCAHQW